MGDDSDGFSPPDASQLADTLDKDPELPTEGPLKGPPSDRGQQESRLAAPIADTALEEVNPSRAMDVAIFIDSERLLAVGRCMRAAGQRPPPSPAPTPLRVTASPPSWHNMPRKDGREKMPHGNKEQGEKNEDALGRKNPRVAVEGEETSRTGSAGAEQEGMANNQGGHASCSNSWISPWGSTPCPSPAGREMPSNCSPAGTWDHGVLRD